MFLTSTVWADNRRYLDVIPVAVAVFFQVNVCDREDDACTRMYSDGPDADAVVRVWVRIVGWYYCTLVWIESSSTR